MAWCTNLSPSDDYRDVILYSITRPLQVRNRGIHFVYVRQVTAMFFMRRYFFDCIFHKAPDFICLLFDLTAGQIAMMPLFCVVSKMLKLHIQLSLHLIVFTVWNLRNMISSFYSFRSNMIINRFSYNHFCSLLSHVEFLSYELSEITS